MTATDGYRSDESTHSGYGMPRGPLSHYDDLYAPLSVREEQDDEPPRPTAIGFCQVCGANARRTCYNRGVFECPHCTRVWYDPRVGTIPRTFDDYFSES